MTKIPEYKYYIFDLDGTLTDSSIAIGEGVLLALKEIGLNNITLDDVKRWIGRPLYEIWEGYAQEYDLDITFNESKLDELAAVYRQGHDMFFPEGVIYYPQVKETLSQIRKNGGKIAIATTKWEEAANWVVRGIGLDEYVDVICGTDPDKPVKPDPFVINLAIERLNANREEAVVIGDTPSDVRAAHAAGCPAVAVDYGFASIEKLKEAEPEYLISKISELINHG